MAKPINANVDVDLDSFKQPVLRYLAHYCLQIPMYVLHNYCNFLGQSKTMGFLRQDERLRCICRMHS